MYISVTVLSNEQNFTEPKVYSPVLTSVNNNLILIEDFSGRCKLFICGDM